MKKQSSEWKEENLAPVMLTHDMAALEAYHTMMGTLLKYQRSNLRELVSFFFLAFITPKLILLMLVLIAALDKYP